MVGMVKEVSGNIRIHLPILKNKLLTMKDIQILIIKLLKQDNKIKNIGIPWKHYFSEEYWEFGYNESYSFNRL